MNMDQTNLIDLIIEKKQFRSYKMISRGKFGATVELDYQDKERRKAVLILKKGESETRKFDFEKIQNGYTVQAYEYEYICRLQAYLIYTNTGEYTLENKVRDKEFQQSPAAIETIFSWMKEVTMGLKKLHSEEYVHLNLHSSIIMITSRNTAKISGFDFSRHSSTLNKRCEIGSESYRRPPEYFVSKSWATDGKKVDMWSLALMTVEALTNNYISQRSDKITSWPGQFAILHKILQKHKFKTTVRNTYPKAAKKENLGLILRLMKHSLKICPEKRPSIGEFLMLLMEKDFLKDFKTELTEEKIWNKKAPLKELGQEIQNSVLVNEPSRGREKMENKNGKEFDDEMLLYETDQSVKIKPSYACFQTPLSKNTQRNITDDTKDKVKEKNFIAAGDGVRKKESSDNVIVKNTKNLKYESEVDRKDEMSGDFVPDELDIRCKDIKGIHFEHTHVHDSEGYSSGTNSAISDSIKMDKPDLSEKVYAKNNIRDKETITSKQNISLLHQSDSLLIDTISDDIYLAEKQSNAVTERHLNENNQEMRTGSIFTTKGMIRKVVNWAFEENFYIGIMHSGSYINKLSKSLTG